MPVSKLTSKSSAPKPLKKYNRKQVTSKAYGVMVNKLKEFELTLCLGPRLTKRETKKLQSHLQQIVKA